MSPKRPTLPLRHAALVVLGALAAVRLVASPYDYAYGSMAHYNERARESALDRMTTYAPNPRGSTEGIFDGMIAQLRENDRQREAQRNAQRNAPPPSLEDRIQANFERYKREHPEQFSQANAFNAALARAQSGSAEDMYTVAHYYRSGTAPVAADPVRALAWFEKSAAAGHHQGLEWAMFILNAGEGVPVDRARALGWRRKQADGGDPDAQQEIGRRLVKGDGLAANHAAGIRYLESAAAQGDEFGIQHLVACYLDPKDESHDPIKARHLLAAVLAKPPGYNFYTNYEQFIAASREAGLNDAEIKAELVSVFAALAPTTPKVSFWLGSTFEGRLGMTRDVALAVQYYELAEAAGDAEAKARLLAIYLNKDSGFYRPEKALAHLRRLLASEPDADFSGYLQRFRTIAAEAGTAPEAIVQELRDLLTIAMHKRPVAAYCLAAVIDDSPSRTQEAATIVRLYRQAAEKEPGDCQSAAALRLYEIYHRGDLAPADETLAQSFLQRASQPYDDVALYTAGVKLRDYATTDADRLNAFYKFADRGFYREAQNPVRELLRREGLRMLNEELAHGESPQVISAMLRHIRFGQFDTELAAWSVEESIRLNLRFPNFYDESLSSDLTSLRQAAECGRPGAYRWLAIEEARILGPTEMAVEFATKGADAGDPGCQNLLGLWRWETSEGQDLSCVPLLEAAMAAGNEDAIFNLARVYEVGAPGIRDEAKARGLYARGAEVGLGAATRQLAVMWAEGRGGNRDQPKGLALLREAAETDRGAAYLLGQHLLSGDWGVRDVSAGCKILQRALARGEWRAGIELAWTFHLGGDILVDEAAARNALLQAAEAAKNDRLKDEAHHEIGECFWYGTCVTADREEAIKWMLAPPRSTPADRLGGLVEEMLGPASTQ